MSYAKIEEVFIIKDWAGNTLFDGKEFETFDDGWDFIYTTFPDEECFDDYFVEMKD